MATISFFRQRRRDGGIRTGVDVDGETVLSRFDDGPANAEADPAIDWYVDIRCEGSRLPREADAARRWLADHGREVRRALRAVADSVPAGIDPDAWPINREFRIGPVRGAVVCSAVRRISAQKISGVLRDVSDHWDDYLSDLLAPQYH